MQKLMRHISKIIEASNMKTNQNIIDYNNTFQAYYSDMLLAINQKDSVKLKADLEKLYADILKNRMR